MGRRGDIFEDLINRDILDLIRSHKTGITFGDLQKEAAREIEISKDTVWQHLKKLCRMGAVSHRGKLYFTSTGAWALLNPKTGYTSSKLDPAGNLYVGLLFSITQITNRYLALLQAVVDAPNISTAHDRAEFFLTAAGDESEMMGLARRVHESKVPLESLIGKKLRLEFVKGQPPTGGVSVRGSTDKQ